ncbi:deoxyguanosinetriphosphate triphosphohydrolase [Corynebacterium sp. zg912]|uniref:Deoxyguanosinetriphosphate triphosphohydrolase n=1 Tax=Corynebacterium wankanglinii TaxID=2735136 RepID=A0A7H0K9E5_9CORY|nr:MULTISPECIES: deoxyguanosinetriphosphate triphosphohydrolase [Corynebacterium]MBA1838045.1 deoxyguanosinetriphosphate triphosphohydrolase [Corynebacterium wankanglinii]MCR5929183.1 deoxyguanosinetriphosphate triphosphohydrolase [Corynebacterium sp. zg912]QNP93911.1 deoxyguanosinetriphosphate triphosphohydrolase [Corynebacterium wankanglinii]
MYVYNAADTQRRADEAPKGAQLAPDSRGDFARDRARVLHSAALRRLADKTQVVGPRDGDTPRTRLTHSLEVAQISRGIGEGLGLNPDLCEMAGLTHDIGHPPYGHNGEVALNEIAPCGFEGNAQTLRILARLEPKVLIDGTSYGLNLTRASLDAAVKYPLTRTNADGSVNRKYSAYDEDAAVLAWVREGHTDGAPPMEAQVMDFSDDIAYSVHDVEDGIVSGRVSLRVLWDFVELAALAQKGAAAFGGDADSLVDAADRLRALPAIAAASEFDYSLGAWAGLKALTSQLVGRYVGAVTRATLEDDENRALGAGSGAGEAGLGLGRQHGRLVVPPDVEAEVRLLKTVAVLYVMDQPSHQARQERQRDRIYRVHEYLRAGAPGSLDTMFQAWFVAAETDLERERVIVDQIASMTESRLERTATKAAAFEGYF